MQFILLIIKESEKKVNSKIIKQIKNIELIQWFPPTANDQ